MTFKQPPPEMIEQFKKVREQCKKFHNSFHNLSPTTQKVVKSVITCLLMSGLVEEEVEGYADVITEALLMDKERKL